MKYTLSSHKLIKYFVKPLLCITLGLSAFGLGTEANAYQDVYNARVIALGCLPNSNTCTLTIDRDHTVTTATASCTRRVFAWNQAEKPYIYNLARTAYYNGLLVGLRYSEYGCYDARREGGGLYMSLGDIWLQ